MDDHVDSRSSSTVLQPTAWCAFDTYIYSTRVEPLNKDTKVVLIQDPDPKTSVLYREVIILLSKILCTVVYYTDARI